MELTLFGWIAVIVTIVNVGIFGALLGEALARGVLASMDFIIRRNRKWD